MTHRIGVVGVGPGRGVDISGRSHSFAYRHADTYADRDDCTLVACVDIEPEYADQFAEEYDIPGEGIYTDHESMLGGADPDVVSVCTPIPTHAAITGDCAAHESVAAVHCEKPMARTWGEARAMAQQCDRADVQLTFGHQRRFGDPFRTAKELIDEGVVGDLDRIEISWGNFFDNGSHTLDLAAMFNDEHPSKWVLGQIDYSKHHVRYGVPTADHAFVSWEYDNGVHGIAATGNDVDLTGGPYDFYDCWHRLVCTDGVIEVGRRGGPALRYRRDGDGWTDVAVDPEFDGRVDLAIHDVLRALDGGHESELRAENALITAEILFAGHESSRRRGRVDLPLAGVYDHPLETMVESGEILPEREDDRPAHPSERDGDAS
ncbi:MAG TPA: Gfo/Idh/MocA family oxidoreductase [Halococcus sp.]|nr:Gfo/Idh/MocA family oxidoreductase [Halococcus sp.]